MKLLVALLGDRRLTGFIFDAAMMFLAGSWVLRCKELVCGLDDRATMTAVPTAEGSSSSVPPVEAIPEGALPV